METRVFDHGIFWDLNVDQQSNLIHRLRENDQATSWKTSREAAILQCSTDQHFYLIFPETHFSDAPHNQLLCLGNMSSPIIHEAEPQSYFAEDHTFLFQHVFPDSVIWQFATDQNHNACHRLVYHDFPGHWAHFDQASFLHGPVFPSTYLSLTDHYQKKGIDGKLLEVIRFENPINFSDNTLTSSNSPENVDSETFRPPSNEPRQES